MPDTEPETLSTHEVNDLRRRIANGYTYDYNEIRDAIAGLRTARQEAGDSAQKKKASSASKKKATSVDLSDLTGDS